MQQEAVYFRGCYDSVGYLKGGNFITRMGGIGVGADDVLHEKVEKFIDMRYNKIHKYKCVRAD
ncbi:MAG: DUF6664 family protein [Agathobacter rectalis]